MEDREGKEGGRRKVTGPSLLLPLFSSPLVFPFSSPLPARASPDERDSREEDKSGQERSRHPGPIPSSLSFFPLSGLPSLPYRAQRAKGRIKKLIGR